ncbi:hypothetical protein OURE66S_02793 [Oligella ureolytica]
MQDMQLDSDQALESYIAPLNPHEKHPIPTMIIQGQRDNVVHQRNANELVKQFLYINNLPMDTVGLTRITFRAATKNIAKQFIEPAPKESSSSSRLSA